MDTREVEQYIQEGLEARRLIDVEQVVRIGKVISEAYRKGRKTMFFGNGGSAADSQHIAAEFVGRFEKERKPLPSLALSVNSSSVTAISNDYSYNNVFERQVRAFSVEGDVAVGLSTSGNSTNVVNALRAARTIGCYCVAMTGSKGGKVEEYAHEVIRVGSSRTSIIQEVHIAVGHILSKIVEEDIFGQ
ncbi:phosphoheptose isomerase [uncultured archaeon]|nr:phosphoheptose isomerase [uncultured archaeon]